MKSSNLCKNDTSVLKLDTPKIEIIDKFKPLFFEKKRYKVYYGGRGGGKTLNFALSLLTMAMKKKMRILCVREIQKSIKDSVHKNLKDIIDKNASVDRKKLNIWNGWTITERSIRYSNGSEFIFSGLKNNVFQIKSMANIDVCWVEEAHAISYSSLKVLKPTIRNEGSEIWFSFNRETENDPVWEEFCIHQDKDTFVCEVNYYNNPKFPEVLEKDRQRDYRKVELGQLALEEYEHVWLGKPKSFISSSYYGKQIRLAEQQQRICQGVFDESLKVHTVWDLGMGDATSIWFFQYYGKQIRLIDYYENSGEGFPFYADVLFKEKKYRYGQHFAPHDINVRELGTGEPRIVIAQRLGIDFYQLPKDNNVIESINYVRRNFHRCWFDSEKTQRGLKCLKNYRKEFDEKRQVYKDKPLHDWASHGCLIAGTKISTDKGKISIEDIQIGDYVITPFGKKKVLNAGLVKIVNELIEITTNKGNKIIMTPEHKVFRNFGIDIADTLRYNDTLINERALFVWKLLNTKAINLGLREAIIKGLVPKLSIRQFGKSIMEQSLKVIEFITRTITHSITKFPIFKFLRRRTTLFCTEKSKNGTVPKKISNNLRKPERKLMCGTEEKREKNSILLWARCLGNTAQSILKNAWCVGKSIKRTILQGPAFVRKNVKPNKEGLMVRTYKSVFASFAVVYLNVINILRPERVVKIAKLNTGKKNIKVYDLTVEKDHCYFANNILVSNSDAFKYLIMAIDKISPNSGFYKTDDEFDEDYQEQYVKFVDNNNPITGY